MAGIQRFPILGAVVGKRSRPRRYPESLATTSASLAERSVYWTASLTCAGSIAALPAISAIVRAIFKTAVEPLIRAGGTPNSELDLEIERLVMDLYGVTPEERPRVWETLKIVRGVKAVTDLVPMSGAAARA